jgi:hypothetical protein
LPKLKDSPVAFGGSGEAIAEWPVVRREQRLNLPETARPITEEPMPAYYIAEHIITDPAKFEDYRVKVAPMIAKHGGRYLTKGGSHKFPRPLTGNQNGLSLSNSRIWTVSKPGIARLTISR